MYFKLVDVGRSKVNRITECHTEQELLKEVCKHLLSREVSIVWTDQNQTNASIYAGVRPVGKIEWIPSIENEIEEADRNQPREV